MAKLVVILPCMVSHEVLHVVGLTRSFKIKKTCIHPNSIFLLYELLVIHLRLLCQCIDIPFFLANLDDASSSL